MIDIRGLAKDFFTKEDIDLFTKEDIIIIEAFETLVLENQELARQLEYEKYKSQLGSVDYIVHELQALESEGKTLDWISKRDFLFLFARFSTMREIEPAITELIQDGILLEAGNGFEIDYEELKQC